MVLAVLSIIGGVIGFLLVSYLMTALTYNKHIVMAYEELGDDKGADKYLLQHFLKVMLWIVLVPVLFLCVLIFFAYLMDFVAFVLEVFIGE
jgi:phosphate/sulfate permease